MCVNYVFCVVFILLEDGRWCCQTIFWRPSIARVMHLLEDVERLRVVARILRLPPSVVVRLWRSYQENGEYTRRQGQGHFRVTIPLQDRFLILLSRRNHMSTAKALEIDFCRATEVHLPDQIVRNTLHFDDVRARRPAQGPVLIAQHRAVRFNFACQHQKWQIRHWMPIRFTDESSFSESTQDWRDMAWRRQGERYAGCNIDEIERYDGGSSWSGPIYYLMVIHTCMCFLEVAWCQQDIVGIFWGLLSDHMHALLVMHSFQCQIMHVPTQLRCPWPSLMTQVSVWWTGQPGIQISTQNQNQNQNNLYSTHVVAVQTKYYWTVLNMEIVYEHMKRIRCMTSLLLYEPYANVSSRFDENLPVRSWFHSNHRVNLTTPR